MSQVPRLATQMHGNEGVTNRYADDRTLDCGRRIAEYLWSYRLKVAICARILYLFIIFSLMTRSARGITSMIQKWLDKLTEI